MKIVDGLSFYDGFLVLTFILTSDCIVRTNGSNHDPLASVILEDMFPETSTSCMHYSIGKEQNGYHTFKYASSNKESKWNTWHGAPFEPEVFLAEMRHESSDPTKAWTMRVAQGGNIYGFRGIYGEAMPPQNHPDAPWIDEVWQMVSVNQAKNRSGRKANLRFFIHQAGTYMKDRPFTKRKVFYSPSLAKHCSSHDRQCSFASWGQQAHVPTPYTSDAMYFNRYRDCGDGVVEVTNLIYNNAKTSRGKWGALDYFNIPWGGVRESNLPEMYLSAKNTGDLTQLNPIPVFGGADEPVPNVRDTAGFTTFGNTLKTSSDDSTTLDSDDTFYMPVTDGRGGAKPVNVAKQQHDALQRMQRQQEVDTRALQALENTTSCDSGLQTAQQMHDPSILRLVVGTHNACHESTQGTAGNEEVTVHCEIDKTFVMNTGEKQHPLVFTNPRTGASLRVRRVVHWALSGTQLWFVPESTDQDFASLMNRTFLKGDEIAVSYGEMSHGSEKVSLTFVHGDDKKGTINRGTPTRLRFGAVPWGNRDYTVFTNNIRRNLPQEYTFVERQYLVTGKLSEAQSQGNTWRKEHVQNIIHPGQHSKNSVIQLYSFSDKNVFGAQVVGKIDCVNPDASKKLMCTGRSTPQVGHRAFFSIECVGSYYFGPDQYHFAPKPGSDKIIRSYECGNRKPDDDPTIRPKWKLIGFFPVNECEEIAGMRYDPTICSVTSPNDEL